MPQIHRSICATLVTISFGMTTGVSKMAEAVQAEYAPLVLQVNDDTFIRFIAWNQIWARAIQNNPGTLIEGNDDEWSLDIGVRRARFLGFGKIGDDVLTMFHWGINNQNFRQNVFQDGGPNFFVHDAWTEFKIVATDMFRLDMGGGLMYWNGISRATNASTLNLLALDGPVTNWPIINATDQFARQLGVYAKGAIAGGLIDYRVALVRPFRNTVFTPNLTPNTWALSSYIKLQVLEPESNTLPYAVGTYLGQKRVLNFGIGQHWHPDGSEDADGNPADIFLFGADVFADIPIGEEGEGGAITAYGVFYYYDFGRDLVRNVGIMNLGPDVEPPQLGDTSRIENGGSNRYASIGQGISVYAQVGYLLPGRFLGLQIQPYVTGQISQWDLYEEVSPVFEGGANFFLHGHHAKFTLHYRARPLMRSQGVVNELDNPDGEGSIFQFVPTAGQRGNLDGFASEFILQTMIFL